MPSCECTLNAQAYLLSLYFDCPEFAGFHCPNETAKEVLPIPETLSMMVARSTT